MYMRIRKTTGLTVLTAILHGATMRLKGQVHVQDVIMLKVLKMGCSSGQMPFIPCAGDVMKRAGTGLLKSARTAMSFKERGSRQVVLLLCRRKR